MSYTPAIAQLILSWQLFCWGTLGPHPLCSQYRWAERLCTHLPPRLFMSLCPLPVSPHRCSNTETITSRRRHTDCSLCQNRKLKPEKAEDFSIQNVYWRTTRPNGTATVWMPRHFLPISTASVWVSPIVGSSPALHSSCEKTCHLCLLHLFPSLALNGPAQAFLLTFHREYDPLLNVCSHTPAMLLPKEDTLKQGRDPCCNCSYWATCHVCSTWHRHTRTHARTYTHTHTHTHTHMQSRLFRLFHGEINEEDIRTEVYLCTVKFENVAINQREGRDRCNRLKQIAGNPPAALGFH